MMVGSTDGVQIAIHDLGGAGPPLLLCHATGFHGRVWQPVAERLTFHCYALDFRGHGDSTRPDMLDIDWHGFGEDVLAAVEGLGLNEVRAAGHSKGGAALLLAEQAMHGTFSSLYLFEPIVIPPMAGMARSAANPLAEGARRRRTTFESLDAAYDNYASKPPLNVLHPDALRAYVDFGFALEPDGSVRLKCRPDTEASTFEMGARNSAFSRLGEVPCPVTVARGFDDGHGPATLAPAVAAALPDARLEEHPALGHFGPLEDPDGIATAITRAMPA